MSLDTRHHSVIAVPDQNNSNQHNTTFMSKQSNLFYQQKFVLDWITIILILAKQQSAVGRVKDRPVELRVREISEANEEKN
jgi:hypothetical protein